MERAKAANFRALVQTFCGGLLLNYFKTRRHLVNYSITLISSKFFKISCKPSTFEAIPCSSDRRTGSSSPLIRCFVRPGRCLARTAGSRGFRPTCFVTTIRHQQEEQPEQLVCQSSQQQCSGGRGSATWDAPLFICAHPTEQTHFNRMTTMMTVISANLIPRKATACILGAPIMVSHLTFNSHLNRFECLAESLDESTKRN